MLLKLLTSSVLIRKIDIDESLPREDLEKMCETWLEDRSEVVRETQACGAWGKNFSSNYFLKIVSIAEFCTPTLLISQLDPIFVQSVAWLVQFRTSILKS